MDPKPVKRTWLHRGCYTPRTVWFQSSSAEYLVAMRRSRLPFVGALHHPSDPPSREGLRTCSRWWISCICTLYLSAHVFSFVIHHPFLMGKTVWNYRFLALYVWVNVIMTEQIWSLRDACLLRHQIFHFSLCVCVSTIMIRQYDCVNFSYIWGPDLWPLGKNAVLLGPRWDAGQCQVAGPTRLPERKEANLFRKLSAPRTRWSLLVLTWLNFFAGSPVWYH